MRKIVAGLFISLDGVIESANDWIGPWFSPEVGSTPDFVPTPLVPKTVMRSILGQAPGVDERAIDLGHPSDVGEDGGRPATGAGGRPP